MPEQIRVERTIRAEARELYDLVSDLPRMGEWSPENTGGRVGQRCGRPGRRRSLQGLEQEGVGEVEHRRRRDGRTIPASSSASTSPVGPFKIANWEYTLRPAGQQDAGRRDVDRPSPAGDRHDRQLVHRRDGSTGTEPAEHGGDAGQAGGGRRGLTCVLPAKRRVLDSDVGGKRGVVLDQSDVGLQAAAAGLCRQILDSRNGVTAWPTIPCAASSCERFGDDVVDLARRNLVVQPESGLAMQMPRRSCRPCHAASSNAGALRWHRRHGGVPVGRSTGCRTPGTRRCRRPRRERRRSRGTRA